jgi:hypothetical protein
LISSARRVGFQDPAIDVTQEELWPHHDEFLTFSLRDKVSRPARSLRRLHGAVSIIVRDDLRNKELVFDSSIYQ